MRRIRRFDSEESLHQQVADYLRLQYPDILYRTDFAAGIKMTIGQAAKHKRLQACRAWPDIQIVEPRQNYHGLFIELKTKSPYRKDGSLLANEHIQEQAEILSRLRQAGYRAEFAAGFTEAQELIDQYLT